MTLSSSTRLAGIAFTLACAGEPAGPPTGPADGSVRGRAAVYQGIEISLESAWIGWGIEPLPGPRLDALSFRVVNGGEDRRAFDPREVRIETADGTYWPRVVVGTEPELRPITLAASEDAFGWIVFRVAADAVPVAAVWTPAPGLALRIPLAPAGKPAEP